MSDRGGDVFFFQAEDGIRDGRVTGVQTCALPISRARLDRAAAGWAARERDLWILLFKAAELPPLGDWRAAAQRVSPRVAAEDPAAHWLLARLDVDRARHAAALHRLAADSAPLAASLDLDLAARQALARRDSTQALRLWDQATRRFDVLSVP